ncbi:MAG TPA: hypothetical protein EYQ54_13415, partial [Myxococcales bacterium]|nr:hypothetical protein [Myxococcales bacterium]
MEDKPSKRATATSSVHGGELRQQEANAITTPIYQTSTFWFKSSQEVMDYQEGKTDREEYGRYGNPTWRAVERKLSELEGGATSSSPTTATGGPGSSSTNSSGEWASPSASSTPAISSNSKRPSGTTPPSFLPSRPPTPTCASPTSQRLPKLPTPGESRSSSIQLLRPRSTTKHFPRALISSSTARRNTWGATTICSREPSLGPRKSSTPSARPWESSEASSTATGLGC